MVPFIFKFNNIYRRVATFISMSLYMPCPLNRRLGAPYFWSGRFEEKEIICHHCKLKPGFSSPQPSHSTLLSDASLICIAQIHKLTPPYYQYRMCQSVVSQNGRDNLDYYYYWYSALWPVWAETRVQSGDWYGSGTLHPGQVLRGSLPLLSPAF